MKYTQEIKLIKDTKRIIAHHNEVARLKGQTFNVFSILKMEHQENSTHSAFIGELLNPKGTHLKGDLFLKIFLNKINDNRIKIEQSTVSLEKHIGVRDDCQQRGGRVDIYITDQTNSICVENKIYAPDQNVQIQRYCNHNKGFNTVYYLTLKGKEASKESKCELKEGEDYYCISYKTDIIEWLEDCLKESVDTPILRESIKQYIILLKKLTNQLSDKTMEKEIHKLIKDNYNAAQTISSAISDVEMEAVERFVKEVADKLVNNLNDDWKVIADDDLSQPWKGIVITNQSWEVNIQIKLEGASKMPWQKSIYGIKAPSDLVDRNKLTDTLEGNDFFTSGFRRSATWPYYANLLYFDDAAERSKLFDDNRRNELKDFVVDKLLELCEASETLIASLKDVNE
ncbi:PDDEXK-like family protein [Aestuariibaculum sediminum]|uniref:PD-(D/E)XK nuclease family protein n=1 Tax=Aestuariibaculum sediminum TaxID=2770637 RepID=A0A8J6Q4B1_9FLAO|nr:PD-(D/E)XK nuclease family protein [Aestuariibaculum sediminum]MBD0833365.1 PD-(D/E)XK nuclease family protein [Aestuariibaculum sediminum]